MTIVLINPLFGTKINKNVDIKVSPHDVFL
jgi:hypothetical protein